MSWHSSAVQRLINNMGVYGIINFLSGSVIPLL